MRGLVPRSLPSPIPYNPNLSSGSPCSSLFFCQARVRGLCLWVRLRVVWGTYVEGVSFPQTSAASGKLFAIFSFLLGSICPYYLHSLSCSLGGSSKSYIHIGSCFNCRFLSSCDLFLFGSFGIPGSSPCSNVNLLLSQARMARLVLCIDAVGTDVPSSCPHCLSSPSHQARYPSLDAEVLWYRTSHRYLHSATTAVHIETPCSVSGNISGCSRRILDGSIILPCPYFIGWYRSLVSCIGTSKYGELLYAVFVVFYSGA